MNQFQYYSAQGIRLMNILEDKTGKMFHELYPKFENAWYTALDAKDINKVLVLHNELCKKVDSLDGELEK